jgi:hypothetical protein
MILERQAFLRFVLYAVVGFAFYYSSIYLGLFSNSLIFKVLAVTFFLVTIPLPSALLNNKQLFPDLKKSGKRLMAFAALVLIFHHFLLSFVVVLLMPGNVVE